MAARKLAAAAAALAGLVLALSALFAGAPARAQSVPSNPGIANTDVFYCWKSGTLYSCSASAVAAFSQASLTGAEVITALGYTPAHSGANSDITSLASLSTPLSVAQGGTGLASLTAHNLLIGNGTSAPTLLAPCTAGQLLIGQGASANPACETAAGDLTLSAGGSFTVTKTNGSSFGTAATVNTGTSGGTLCLLSSACTWSSIQSFPASASGHASINLAPGATPSSPNNGDFWVTSLGVFAQVAGSTVQLATTSGPVTSFNTRTGAVTLSSSDVTTALGFTPLSTTGTAAKATQLATARNLSTSGDVACGPNSFDGTADVTLTGCALSTTGVTAATYGDSTHVAQFTVDATGRISSASNVAIGICEVHSLGTISAGGFGSFTHSLGRKPYSIQFFLTETAFGGNVGYSQNDVVYLGQHYTNDSTGPAAWAPGGSTTTIDWVVGASSNIALLNPSTGNGVDITYADWSLSAVVC